MAPRLPPKGGKRTPRSSTPIAPPAKGSVMGDNRLAMEAAEQAQLISIVSRLRMHAPNIERAKKALDEQTQIEKDIYKSAANAGFEKKEIKAYLEDLKPGSSRFVAEREEARVRRRRWLGLAVGERQPEVDLAAGIERDELYWAREGFQAGMTGGEREIPKGCAPESHQTFLSNYDKGHDEAKRIIGQHVPGKARLENSVREQSAQDFAADNPGVEAEKAADPAAPGATDVEAPFEATEEELQGQAARRAVQDAAAGRTSGEIV